MHTKKTIRITAYFMLVLITGLLRKDLRSAAPGYSRDPAEDTKDADNR